LARLGCANHSVVEGAGSQREDAGGLSDAFGPTLSFLIKFANDLHARQIAGEPSWLGAERYDMTGKPDKPWKPSLPQLKAMIRELLADRFQLTVHHEKRELPVYAITTAKSGSKLIENDNDPNGVWGGEGISPRRLGYKNMTPDNVGARPDLFTAFQEQLGLKLGSTKALVDVFVVDRVEQPSAN
jgi:uncharacterized protein (TIGR03435 family)